MILSVLDRHRLQLQFASLFGDSAEHELESGFLRAEAAKHCPKLWLAATIQDVPSFASLYKQEVVNVLVTQGF